MNGGNLQVSDSQNRIMAKEKFLEDVLKGLQSHPKYLLSKYFYDSRGDELFERIMGTGDYYLTRCELRIFKKFKSIIADRVLENNKIVDIIALGPGDSSKTIYLIKELAERNAIEKYFPIDISSHVINSLQPKFAKILPQIKFYGMAGEYFEMLPQVLAISNNCRLVFFVGATIGNFLPDEMIRFCQRLKENLRKGDLVLIGFDLKKDPRKILAAYNDSDGWTARFNLNLLRRINEELGGNFNEKKFIHFPTYDPQTGTCKSFLISKSKQSLNIGGKTISFELGEPIHMEVSQKYDLDQIEKASVDAGFKQIAAYTDSKNYFVDVLWEVL